ncbi:MAG TPA: hypothetical protein VMG10_31330 [Gemmataceae bacterium]|nr:hypothetical protein [Gemmataceae bacterium]
MDQRGWAGRHAQPHRQGTVTHYKSGEGGFITLPNVTVQKHDIGGIDTPRRGGSSLHLSQGVIDGSGHDGPPQRCRYVPMKILSHQAAKGTSFFPSPPRTPAYPR